MKNALVYVINNSKYHIAEMINSINSFAKNNESLLKNTEVLIFTYEQELDLSGIVDGVHLKIVRDFTHDYENMPKNVWGKVIYLKYELFANPLLFDYDNVLLLDVDTEVVSSVEPLLNSSGGILMPQDVINHLKQYDFMPKDWRYFNSGTVLVRPKVLGREVIGKMFDMMMESQIKYADIFKHPEQDTFNYVFSRPEFIKFFVAIDDVAPKGQYRFGYQLKKQLAENNLPKEISIIHHVGSAKKHPYKLRFLD